MQPDDLIASENDEVPLAGGRITQGVVRVGGTVRRPTGDHSPFVHDLLRHLEARGFDAAPRLLGIDERGREILTYLEGQTFGNLNDRRWTERQVREVGGLLRKLHDATEGCELAGDAEIVCHGDFSPTNVVFVDAVPVKVFDFDGARPGRRVHDLAYSAWLWLLGAEVDERLDHHLDLLQVLLDAYGADQRDRSEFGEQIVARVEIERVSHERAGRTAAFAWVCDEIDWLRRHEARITAAASRSRPVGESV